MLTNLQDFAPQFNQTGVYVIDASVWDYVSIQPIGGSGVAIQGTNDGGAIESQMDGSPSTANNFVDIDAVDQTTGTAASTIAAGSIGRITVGCQYIKISGTDVTKLLVLGQRVF